MCDIPDCRCLRLALMHYSEHMRPLAVAKVFYVWVEAGSMFHPTGIIVGSAELLCISYHK